MRYLQPLFDWAKRLKRDVMTLWFAYRHPDTPWYAKAIGVFVVAYALSPIDLIPDFIPVLGYVDDIVLLPGLIWLAIRLTPANVIALCRQQSDEWMSQSAAKPRSFWGAAIIVLIWLGVGLLLWSLWMRA